MTPEEAKQRWCPFANAEAYKHARCIADCCMAWRWSWSPEQAKKNYTKPSGYCGLAGAHGN